MADFNFVDDFDGSSSQEHTPFLQHDMSGDELSGESRGEQVTPTEPLEFKRAASYRPPEEVARRMDVASEFKRSMLADFNLLRRDASASELSSKMLFASALADESLGHFDSSARTLNDLRRHSDLDETAWRVVRRIARQLNEWALVEDALKQSFQLGSKQDSSFAVYDALEQATLGWMKGDAAEHVGLLCESASSRGEQVAGFAAFWRAQLLSDAMLSMGDLDGGMEVLCELVDEHRHELPTDVYQSLEWMVAAWHKLNGEDEIASERLLLLDREHPLPAGMIDLLVFMLAGRGEVARVRSVLQDRHQLNAPHAALRSRLLASVGEINEACADVEGISRNHASDGFLLRVQEEILESCHVEVFSHERAEVEERLIHILNLRLEASPSDEECIALLLRLGRLYEEMEGGADDAAAEVYREALGLEPQNPAIIRSLGRVYHRNQSWDQLAALYEHEINVFGDEPFVWRRHFEVAKLYEQRLSDSVLALEHYAAVLAERPHYLPALKSAAHIMEQNAQWAELADMFLARVPTAKSSRQRLYMLDKVAEIAEVRLGLDDIAIDAWKEILLLSPEHPKAFSSLGRLLHRAARWKELIELNQQEMELMDDPEEIADLYLKNAEVFEKKLLDDGNAELCYRRALQLVPDFVPALKGLGRLLMHDNRWDDLVDMIQQELYSLQDPRERALRFGALAEIAEFQLDRPQVAIHLYEKMQGNVGADVNAFFALRRLYRAHQRWAELDDLLRQRLDFVSDTRTLVALHTELAELHEWHMGNPQVAFEHYRAALCIDPSEVHSLYAIGRLWPVVGQPLESLVSWLEELSVQAELDGDVLESYRSLICRLHMHILGAPEAAYGLRQSSRQSSEPEHAIMIRLTDALNGERANLALRRVKQPMHSWEVAMAMPRHGLNQLRGVNFDEVMSSLDVNARQWFAMELELAVTSKMDLEFKDQCLLLGHELAKFVHHGARVCDSIVGPETGTNRLRLRALESKIFKEFDEYELWTRREVLSLTSQDIQIRRLLEMAHGVEGVRRDDLLHDAARIAFPELVAEAIDGEDESSLTTQVPLSAQVDSSIVDELYDALYQAECWVLLRECLDIHVARAGVSRIRKAYLFDMLSDMLERYLDEPDAALEARRSCYELSREPDHVIAMVRLCEQLGDDAQALDYQRMFFELLWERADIGAGRCVKAGLKFARMLRATGEDHYIVECIQMLDALLARFDGFSEMVDVRLELARSHASHGDPHRAAELYRRTLTPETVSGREDDWRQFVAIWRDELANPEAAYTLQWTLVHHDPCDESSLSMLVDLAEESGALDNCAHELLRVSEHRTGAQQRSLRWKAAIIFDEYLGWFDLASQTYELLLVGCIDSDEKARLNRRHAFCLTQLPGRQLEALSTFRELVKHDPFDVATYRGMSSLFGSFNNYDRARVITQVQRLLGDEIPLEQTRHKTIPSRSFEQAGVLDVLLPEGLTVDVVHAIASAMPLATKLWSEVLPQRKALENNRKASRELLPVADLFHVVFDSLELTRLKVWFGDSNPVPVQLLNDGSPLVWLNTETLEAFDEPELRFLAGYCAALSWAEVSGLLHLDGRQVWHLLEGVYYRQVGKGFGERIDVMSQELSEQVSSPLYAVARRRVLQTLEGVTEQLEHAHCEAWPRAFEQFAYRVGLVLCGDVEAAARCILKLQGWRGEIHDVAAQRLIRRDDHIRELLAFALSEDYLDVRYLMGLAGKPSEVSLHKK